MFTGCHRLKRMADTSRHTSFRSACQYSQADRHFYNCLPDSIHYTLHHASFVASNTACAALTCYQLKRLKLKMHSFLLINARFVLYLN
jgi:hypothetical protein